MMQSISPPLPPEFPLPKREYVRLDDRRPEPISLQDTLNARLHDSGYRSLRHIKCQVESGVALLTGRIPSFYLKQIAQEIIRNVDGVKHVQNLLEVSSELEAK